MTAPLQNGGAWSSSSPRAPAPAHATGSAQGRQDAECARDSAQLSVLLQELAPASLDAPISDAGAFFEDQVLRLILLTDLHKAKRAHRPTARIAKRLRDVTARLAAQ